MKKIIGKWLLNLFGWKLENKIPKDIKKFVLVAAPHTSNWDFMVALPSMWMIDLKGKYLIKKELFWWPLSWFLRTTGGIPVDRKSMNKDFVRYLNELFDKHDEFGILFTPEGTRSWTKKWKTGFHRISMNLDIPIILAYADFDKKQVRVGDVFYPTNNLEEDLKRLEDYYKGVLGKHPEKFNQKFFER